MYYNDMVYTALNTLTLLTLFYANNACKILKYFTNNAVTKRNCTIIITTIPV